MRTKLLAVTTALAGAALVTLRARQKRQEEADLWAQVTDPAPTSGN